MGDLYIVALSFLSLSWSTTQLSIIFNLARQKRVISFTLNFTYKNYSKRIFITRSLSSHHFVHFSDLAFVSFRGTRNLRCKINKDLFFRLPSYLRRFLVPRNDNLYKNPNFKSRTIHYTFQNLFHVEHFSLSKQSQ